MKALSIFERWALKRILKKVVCQGSHQNKVVAFLEKLVYEMRYEFSEDNQPKIDSFLNDSMSKALKNMHLGKIPSKYALKCNI